MALPQHKTCLSILRSILGPGAGNEARFAKKIGRSASWLKKASCGQIPLSRDAAVRIGYETGINVYWLFNSDITKPAINDDGHPYTIQTYINHQRLLEYGIYNNTSVTILELMRLHDKSIERNQSGIFNYYLSDFIFNMSAILKLKDK